MHTANRSSTIELSARSALLVVRGLLADVEIADLLPELDLQRPRLWFYGREVDQPRETAVQGISYDPASHYRTRRPDTLWTPRIGGILERIQTPAPGPMLNSMIANYYRDGRDSISWHADDEPALGENPYVVAASFGATRRLAFRPNPKRPDVVRTLHAHHVDLEHGDLLVMFGRVQSEFQHQIAKVASAEPRLSLTFRHYI